MQKLLLYLLVILLCASVTAWAQEIDGTLLMLDDKTPHVVVPVQAILDGEVVITVLSDELGRYKFVDLKPGNYQVRCQVMDGYVYYGEEKTRRPESQKVVGEEDGTVAGRSINSSTHEPINLKIEEGDILKDIDFRFAPFKKGVWKNYDTLDGLAGNAVNAIHRDPDGVMWFGTDSGISRYDGKEFVNLTTKDGLAGNSVHAIHRDPDGVMWFAAKGGVSRYDSREFVNFTTKDGLAHNIVYDIYRDPDGMMWFGTKGGVSCYDGKEFVNFTTEEGLADNDIKAIHRDPDGVMWFAAWSLGVCRYDGKEFVNLTAEDGLIGDYVSAVYCDPDGAVWFGDVTAGSKGLSRYSENRFVNFTTEDGLASKMVRAIHRDPDGVMWFGTEFGISSRYDGKEITRFTTKDGLAGNNVGGIDSTPDGMIWFGTYYAGGVSRYDGKEFVNFGTEDGLAYNQIPAIHHSPDGIMWFATYGGGVSRYDGRNFANFTTKDGLADDYVWDVYCDPDGVVWFGTGARGRGGGGVSRYDGKEFVNLTTEDGLAHNSVLAIHRDADGVMWFGTYGGVSRYDGKKFANFTTEDGLAHNLVFAIYRDVDGILWLGTDSGACGYDGTAWTSLDARDGLIGHGVFSISQDLDGFMWFATGDRGVTRYWRSTTPPQAYIVSVTIDQTYRDLSAIPAFTPGTRVTMKFGSIDLKTVPEKRQYRIRIVELNSDWRRPMKADSVDLVFDESGTYTLQVQAIDRDLNYSEPASLTLEVVSPFYTRAGFIIGAILVAFLIPSSVLAAVVIRQRRQAFEPISNPYIVGNPIRAKEMFFGRESDFEFVRAKLATGQSGLVIVFAGERRSGKTSILFQILEGALGEQFVPVLADMQAMAVDSDAQFLEQMALEIDEALVSAGCETVQVDSWESDPVRTFRRFISHSMEQLGSKSLLLMLDEYELIETKMDDGVLRPDLITFFASLLEAHPRLSLIFTGSRHLEGRKREYWSILIGKSLYRRISFLSEQDALRLIMEPVQDLVVYPRGIPERIVRLTAGQPFYTQVMCQNMMDRLNEVERNRVRQEDVDAVAQELADNPLPQMIYFWDGLEQEYKGVLSLLGEVLEDSNGYASAQMLVNFVQEQKLALELELSDLERVLNDLFVNEMLERERAGEGQYEYRFRADLFRLWVRQAHSVWE